MSVQQITIKVELFFDGVWNDITGDVRGQPSEGFGVQIRRGRKNEDQVVPPTTINLTVNNCNGRYTPTNPNSPLFGKIGRNTPLRVSVNGQIRAVGEVSEWPLNWDQFGKDVWVPIQAAGILRRLGQGQEPLRPSTERFARLTGAVAFWPMDDPAGSIRAQPTIGTSTLDVEANRVIEAIDGDIPLLPRWDAGVLAPWVGNAPEFERFRGQVTESPDTFVNNSPNVTAQISVNPATAFTIAFLIRGNPTMTPPGIIIRIGEDRRLVIAALDGQDQTISALIVDDAGATIEDFGSFTVLEGLWAGDGTVRVVQLDASNARGAGILDWLLHVNGEVIAGAAAVSSGETITLLGDLFMNAPVSPPGTKVLIGHLGIWDSVIDPTDLFEAYSGHAGEPAGVRIERLTFEEGIPQVTIGDGTDTVLMGPQYPDGLLTILREAEQADLGILFETKDQLGLAYRTRVSLYNQEPVLAIDYESCHLRHPLRGTYDDRFVRNDITASRRDGGSARVFLESGSLSVQDPPDGVGLYSDEVTLNVASDLQLPNQASWRLHLGTVDEARYPVIRVRNLAPPSCPLDPNLATETSAVDLGDKLTIANPPVWLPPDTVEQLVQGYDEDLDRYKWLIPFNATPASPFTIGIRLDTTDTPGPADPSRRDTAGSVLNTSFNAGVDTSLDVETTLGPFWGTTGASNMDFPLDLRISGARVRVTAIAAAIGQVQTFTCEQTIVNGVNKIIAAGTDVRLWQPAVRGL